MMNPTDSNIYRQLILRSTCDSKGVEHGYKHLIFYKYAIPLGLAWQKCYNSFLICKIEN
jgi:hypothetical protein